MSLLGLSLVVGILVDDAIVVLVYIGTWKWENRVRAAWWNGRDWWNGNIDNLVIVVVFYPLP
jgi:HAE1 family hydrophobic/amphiphilic exporter-1